MITKTIIINYKLIHFNFNALLIASIYMTNLLLATTENTDNQNSQYTSLNDPEIASVVAHINEEHLDELLGFLSAFILGSLGFITGLWAEKFDHTATVTNFVITPLSFLSGVFYSIEKLPIFFQTISHLNPFFYMIDGFRYGFLGTSDGSIRVGLIYLTLLSFVMWFLAFYLYKKGYKIKS